MKQHRNFGLFLAAAALIGCALAPASAQHKVDAKGLPAGWAAAPLGNELGDDRLLVDQSVSVDDKGVWTISAGGYDLWTENDGGLIVYMKHTGDGRASFRLLSQQKGNDGTTWVKTAAGFRESLKPDSRDVHISYTSDNSLEPAVRVNAGETPKHPGDADSGGVGFNGNGSDTVPQAGHQLDGKSIYIGVDRQGKNFGYYYSDDGQIWTSIGNVNIDLPADLLAGIEATNHNDANDATTPNQVSMLDNVTVDNQLIRTQSIQNLTMKAGSAQVLITFDPPVIQGKEITFNVYQIDEAGKSGKKMNADPIKTGSFTVTGLTNGTEYRFGVTAIVDGKESALQVNFSKEEGNPGIPSVTPG